MLTSRYLRFAVALALVALVWLVVLPLIGEQPAVSRHIAEQQRLGIDPSAKFYSELEFLPPVVHRMERLHLLQKSWRAGDVSPPREER